MRSEAKSAFGGRKFLLLGILLTFLTAGLVFGQGIPIQEQQEQNQPVPAPYLVLFGTQWDLCGYGAAKEIKELGVTVGIVFVKDRNSMLGIIDLIVIVKDKKEIPVAGWINSFTPQEKGFVINDAGEPILTKAKADGEVMLTKSGQDKNGNYFIVFYLTKESGQPEVLKWIDINKFVADNFKDPGK